VRVPAVPSWIRPASLALAVALCVLGSGIPAEGQQERFGRLPGWPSAVAVGSGAVNVARRSDEAQLNWELQFEPRPFRLFDRLRLPDPTPIAGVMAAADGSMYAYGGARLELPLGRRWLFLPSWAMGVYYRHGGKELGLPLEFRSGVELAYRLRGRHLVGVALYHISNGGLSDSNPGTEALLLTYGADLR
jgi:lipid A 3-O-deacylase